MTSLWKSFVQADKLMSSIPKTRCRDFDLQLGYAMKQNQCNPYEEF